MKKAIVTVVYALGAFTVFVLVCVFLSHSEYVPFPDAMLPTRLWELATEWLVLGTAPMTVSCVLMRKTHETRGEKTVLVFLPAMLCAAALLFWLGVWTAGLWFPAQH